VSQDDPTLALQTEGLSRGYGRRWALAGLNLRMKPGNSLLVAGSNGAGKTTLLRLLATTLRPTSGSLRIFGIDPVADPMAARRKLGLLSHRTHLYDDLTARETLSIAARLGRFGRDPVRDDRLLERVGLTGRGDDVVRGFSAGMRKRLSFARLLLQDPDVVLIDEPYGQLDPAGFDFVDGLLTELREAGKTLVVSSHRVDRSATLVKSGLVLAGGKMFWVGDAPDLPAALEESLGL
jgi:heme exporter protein A